MVIVSPQDLGLWDPFQMAEIYGLYMGGDPFTTYDTWEPILQVTTWEVLNPCK